MTNKERELLELVKMIAVDYDGYRTAPELMQLIDEMSEMVGAVLEGNAEEYIEKLNGYVDEVAIEHEERMKEDEEIIALGQSKFELDIPESEGVRVMPITTNEEQTTLDLGVGEEADAYVVAEAEGKVYRIYDDRNNETILETTDEFEAMLFMSKIGEDHPDFKHIWLDK